MSKRQRHKKKKKLKLQKLRRSMMSESRSQVPTLSVRDPDRSIGASGKISEIAPQSGVEFEAMPAAIDEVPPADEVAKAPAEQKESESIIDAPTRKFIARDIRLILFTLLGLAVILTIIKILQLKTGYINSFGDWLYKITNIQTL